MRRTAPDDTVPQGSPPLARGAGASLTGPPSIARARKAYRPAPHPRAVSGPVLRPRVDGGPSGPSRPVVSHAPWGRPPADPLTARADRPARPAPKEAPPCQRTCGDTGALDPKRSSAEPGRVAITATDPRSLRTPRPQEVRPLRNIAIADRRDWVFEAPKPQPPRGPAPRRALAQRAGDAPDPPPHPGPPAPIRRRPRGGPTAARSRPIRPSRTRTSRWPGPASTRASRSSCAGTAGRVSASRRTRTGRFKVKFKVPKGAKDGHPHRQGDIGR